MTEEDFVENNPIIPLTYQNRLSHHLEYKEPLPDCKSQISFTILHSPCHGSRKTTHAGQKAGELQHLRSALFLAFYYAKYKYQNIVLSWLEHFMLLWLIPAYRHVLTHSGTAWTKIT